MSTTVAQRPAALSDGARPRAGKPCGRSRLAAHPAWVVVVMLGALLWALGAREQRAGDVFWQLAAGNWMLARHRVITKDPFSYTVCGRPWFALEWGFEVLLALGVRLLGGTAYWLASAGACLVAYGASVARWRLRGTSMLLVAALALEVAAGLAIGLDPRPQDASYALFAIELLVLECTTRRAWLALVVPALVAVWANLHGSFILGIGTIALAATVATVAARRDRAARGGAADGRSAVEPWEGSDDREPTSGMPAKRSTLGTPAKRSTLLWAGTAASVVAGVLNPHGLAIYPYVARVSTSSQLNAFVEEWRSPNFHSPLLLAIVAAPLFGLIALGFVLRRRLDAFDLVLAGVLFLAALHAVRFVPYFAIASAGMLAVSAPKWGPEVVRRHEPSEGLRPRRATLPVAVAAAMLLIGGSPVHSGSVLTTGPLGAPVRATEALLGRQGRVFSTYWWNDYLLSLGIPVFVDGRTDLYAPTPVLHTYLAVAGLRTNPDPVLAEYRVRFVLWPPSSALATYLGRDPAWRLVLRTRHALLFERVTLRGGAASNPKAPTVGTFGAVGMASSTPGTKSNPKAPTVGTFGPSMPHQPLVS
jgi:hypothetical protein